MAFSNLFPCIYRVCHSLWVLNSIVSQIVRFVLRIGQVRYKPACSVVRPCVYINKNSYFRNTYCEIYCSNDELLTGAGAEKRCPTSPPSSAGPGRGCAGALRTSSVAGTGPSGLDVPPRPRGWKQRGLGAGEEAELSGGPALDWLGLCGRGEG